MEEEEEKGVEKRNKSFLIKLKTKDTLWIYVTVIR